MKEDINRLKVILADTINAAVDEALKEYIQR